jgi:hypothetical protein
VTARIRWFWVCSNTDFRIFSSVSSKDTFAAAHSIFCNCKRFSKPIFRKTFCRSAPGKGRNVLGLKSCTEYIHTYANNRASVEHGRNSCFGIIAHHQSAEEQSGLCERIRNIAMQFDRAMVIFKIRIIGISPKITPFSQNRITEVAVMPFIAITKYNAVTYLSADFAKRPYGVFGRIFVPCASTELSPIANGPWIIEPSCINALRPM